MFSYRETIFLGISRVYFFWCLHLCAFVALLFGTFALIGSKEALSQPYDFDFDVELSFVEAPYESFLPVPPENPFIPTGYTKWGLRDQCSIEGLGESIREVEQVNASSEEIARHIRERLHAYLYSDCGEDIAEKGQHGIVDYGTILDIEYNLKGNEKIREVLLKIIDKRTDGGKQVESIRGLLAIHDNQARPLIVLKCGFLCAASTDYMSKHVMAHIFDQTPFNLLLLSSNTSHEYLLDNQRVSIGGVEEGQQLVKIARWLRTKSRFKSIISTLHIAGVSQGGQAALYSSIFLNYDDGAFNKDSNGREIVNSNLALCPVVNLHSTIAYTFQRSMVKSVMAEQLRDTLYKVYDHEKLPNSIREQFPNRSNIGSHGYDIIRKLVRANTSYYYDDIARAPVLPPFSTSYFPTTPQKLWTENNFSAKFVYGMKEGEGVPTFIWAPKNDAIIDYDSSGIVSLMENLSSKYPENNKIQILTTEHGHHCAFSMAYGWPMVTEVLRSYVLAHDRNFYDTQKAQKRPFHISSPLDIIHPRYFHADQHWEWEWEDEDNNRLALIFKILIPTGRCTPSGGDINAQKENCYHYTKYITSSSNGVWYEATFSKKRPTSETEAQIATRWLNANVKLLNENGEKLKEKKDIPTYIEWSEYGEEEEKSHIGGVATTLSR